MEKNMHRLPEGCGYRIVRQLGSGGEGTVYLVCHLRTEQLRAAKILTAVHRGRRHELDLMKHLDHPSLPKVIDVLAEGEDIWLIMEYIRGRRLDSIVGEGLSAERLFSVALQLIRAVQYLHRQKEPVFHLDIKPSNILIRPDGSLVLIDFGAAIRGHLVPADYDGYGTRGFAAPEQQKKGARIDARTDLYGIGATLYYCQTGRPPEAGCRCGGPLGSVIRRCLAEDPAGRYQDCGQLLQAVLFRQRRAGIGRRILPAACAASAGLLLVLLLGIRPGGTPVKESQTTAAREAQAGNERTRAAEEWEQESAFEDGADHESRRETEPEPESTPQDGAQAEAETEPEAGTEPEPETETEDSPADLVLQLLEQVTADGVFDAEEETAVLGLLCSAPDGSEKTVWSRLQEDADACGPIFYRLGLAYWYFYDGAGGKSTAAHWFDRALSAASGKEAAPWEATAEVFARIGNYYSMLGNTRKEKKRIAMEWEYWNDLKELWRLLDEQEETEAVRTEQAGELLSLEILKAYEIGCCGETKEEMLRILAEVGAFAEGSRQEEELIRQSQAARAAVERAFQELMGEENIWVEAESIG